VLRHPLCPEAKLHRDLGRLADVLRRSNDHPASRLEELLPWNWKLRLHAAAA
jgi:hypothetical protein